MTHLYHIAFPFILLHLRVHIEFLLFACLQAFDGEVTLIDTAGPLKTQVWLHRSEGNEVIKMEIGHAYELTGVDAVAVTPLDNAALSAKTLTCNLFQEKAERVGASLMLAV